MIRPGIPSTVDRSVLQSYLNDHLTGASAGRARCQKMSEWYAELPVGPELAQIADELDQEHAHLADLIDKLGLKSALPMRLAARGAEMVGRLKPNGRGPLASPVTPLFEIELLRAAVNGKQGLWQVLADYSEELGLDRAQYEKFTGWAERQQHILEGLHAQLRPTALRPDRYQP